jgi:hypothetical protein
MCIVQVGSQRVAVSWCMNSVYRYWSVAVSWSYCLTACLFLKERLNKLAYEGTCCEGVQRLRVTERPWS